MSMNIGDILCINVMGLKITWVLNEGEKNELRLGTFVLN